MRIENTSCSPLLAWFDKLTIRGFDWLTIYGFDTSTRLSAGFAHHRLLKASKLTTGG
jgi:hypothetical protein